MDKEKQKADSMKKVITGTIHAAGVGLAGLLVGSSLG